MISLLRDDSLYRHAYDILQFRFMTYATSISHSRYFATRLSPTLYAHFFAISPQVIDKEHIS